MCTLKADAYVSLKFTKLFFLYHITLYYVTLITFSSCFAVKQGDLGWKCLIQFDENSVRGQKNLNGPKNRRR